MLLKAVRIVLDIVVMQMQNMKHRTWSNSVTLVSQNNFYSLSPILGFSFSFSFFFLSLVSMPSKVLNPPSLSSSPLVAPLLFISIENQVLLEGAHAAHSACVPSTLFHYGTHHSWEE